MTDELQEAAWRMVTLDEYLAIRDLIKEGLSQAEVARRLGVHRHTVAKYLKTSPPTKQKRNRDSRLSPHYVYLRTRMAQGCRNGKVLLREIRQKGYSGSYTVLKDFLRPMRGQEKWRAEVRWEAPAGVYAQVDWGHFIAQLPDHTTVKLYAFIFTMAYSRAIYVEWTTGMDLATLERCHERAFAYLGGVPKYITYDRMKTVVVGEDGQGEARFHPGFADFASYYGFTPRAAPAYWPRGKGKVESSVKYVRHNFWEGLTSFVDTEDLNARCRQWLDEVANTRIHGTTGQVPFDLLKGEGLAVVAGRPPYPAHPAVVRLVSRDCLVSYGGSRYSVPAEWANKSVWVRLVSQDRIVVTAGSRVISELPIEPVLKRTVINDRDYDALRSRPHYQEVKVLPMIEPPHLDVERRSLSEYQALMEAAP